VARQGRDRPVGRPELRQQILSSSKSHMQTLMLYVPPGQKVVVTAPEASVKVNVVLLCNRSRSSSERTDGGGKPGGHGWLTNPR
jgi:hypothetical protein